MFASTFGSCDEDLVTLLPGVIALIEAVLELLLVLVILLFCTSAVGSAVLFRDGRLEPGLLRLIPFFFAINGPISCRVAIWTYWTLFSSLLKKFCMRLTCKI